MKNSICIGINSDAFKAKNGMTIIGNFTDEETKANETNDCVIIQNRLIIKKDILDFLGIKYQFKKENK